MMTNAQLFLNAPRMGSSIRTCQSTLQDIEEGRNTLLKELSVKDWLGHTCMSLAKSSTTGKIFDNWVPNFNE